MASNDAIGTAFLIVFAAQGLGTIVYLVNVGRLFRRIETQHRSVHESLGSPLLFANNTPRNNVLFLRWLWAQGFESLRDADTVALAALVRSLFVWLLYGFATMATLFAILMVTL